MGSKVSKIINPPWPFLEDPFTDSSDEDDSQKRDPHFRIFNPLKRPRCRSVPSHQQTSYDPQKGITLLCVTNRDGELVVDPRTTVISINFFNRNVGDDKWACSIAAYAGPRSKYNKVAQKACYGKPLTRFASHAYAMKFALMVAQVIVDTQEQVQRVKIATESRALIWVWTHMHEFHCWPDPVEGWRSLMHADSLTKLLRNHRKGPVKCQLWYLKGTITDYAQDHAWTMLETCLKLEPWKGKMENEWRRQKEEQRRIGTGN